MFMKGPFQVDDLDAFVLAYDIRSWVEGTMGPPIAPDPTTSRLEGQAHFAVEFADKTFRVIVEEVD